jgi:hypothetical protein
MGRRLWKKRRLITQSMDGMKISLRYILTRERKRKKQRSSLNTQLNGM